MNTNIKIIFIGILIIASSGCVGDVITSSSGVNGTGNFTIKLLGFPDLTTEATISCGTNMSCSQAGTTISLDSLGTGGGDTNNYYNFTNYTNGTTINSSSCAANEVLHNYDNGTGWECVINDHTGFLTSETQTLSDVLTQGNTANMDINFSEIHSIVSLESMRFNLTPNITIEEGMCFWDDDAGTLSCGMKGGNVNLQIGSEMYIYATNKESIPIVDGQVVYITGAQGFRPTVELAIADNETTSTKTIAVATETINNNNNGYFTTMGIVHNINTSMFSDGDKIYLSTSTAGGLTNIKPTSPNHSTTIGFVLKSHATEGELFVSIDNGFELDELHDVDVLTQTKLSGQALIYNATAGLWRNENVTAINHTHDIEYFYPINITMNNGASITGNHTVLAMHNDLGVKIMETTGTSALTVTLNWTSPDMFETLLIYGKYDGSSGHYINVDIYNNNETTWHNIGSIPSSISNISYSFNIPDPEHHIDGNTTVRLTHVGTGNINHYLWLDYVTLEHGGSAGNPNTGLITAHISNTSAHTDSDNISQFTNDAGFVTNATITPDNTKLNKSYDAALNFTKIETNKTWIYQGTYPPFYTATGILGQYWNEGAEGIVEYAVYSSVNWYDSGAFKGGRGRGNYTSSLPVQSGDQLFTINAKGIQTAGGQMTSTRGSVSFMATENWSSTTTGTEIWFVNTKTGTNTRSTGMKLKDDNIIVLGLSGSGNSPITVDSTGKLSVNRTAGAGIPINSPSGTAYCIRVSDAGVLSTTTGNC